MRIKAQLLLFLIPAIFVALGLLTFFSYQAAQLQAEKLALEEATSIAEQQSTLTFDAFQQAETAATLVASTLVDLRKGQLLTRPLHKELVKGAALSSSNYFGIWVLWEENALDNQDAKFVNDPDYGNKQGRGNSFWRRDGSALVYDASDDYDTEDYYAYPKASKKMVIMPPYKDQATPDKDLMTSVVVPLLEGNTVLGVVGIDIHLNYLHDLIKQVTPYTTGYAMLVSDKGSIVASPLPFDKNMSELPTVSANVLENIQSGNAFSCFEKSIVDGSTVQCFYTPVRLRGFEAPWYFMVALPMDKVMAESNNALLFQLGISGCALLILIALVLYTSNKVSDPIQRISAYAQQVAGGNYNSQLENCNFAKELCELHQALTSMLDSLLNTMQQAERRGEEANQEAERARLATDEAEKAKLESEENHKAMLAVAKRVDGVAQQLQKTSGHLSQNIGSATEKTHEQSKLMTRTVEAIADMTNSVHQVTANANDADHFAERTQARASEGASIVNLTLEAFDNIRRETEILGSQIEDLSHRTEAIGDILDMINDIADQTNLLALNAAIEAARAGDAGRGFAVVADEVRKLAEKTMQATRQVEESVVGIRNSMRVSAQGVSRTTEQVQSTVSLGHDAQTSLTDIVTLVQRMSAQIHEIAELCVNQTKTSEQVMEVVGQLQQLSQTVSQSMSENAEITATLTPEAKELGALVNQLTKNG